ncbi:MAG: VanZ family protein [Colwellia sp.]|nr:VanZ family protein [Colwellia sp.]
MIISIHNIFYALLLVKTRHHLIFFIVIISAAILLFFSSELLLPTELKKIVFRSPQIDTIGHFIGFFILAWLSHSLIKLTLLEALITLSFYGALSELGQYYLGFRNGEFSDFFADIAGISLFILLKSLYLIYKKTCIKRLTKKSFTKTISPRLNQ